MLALILVEIAVCWSVLPIASATLMKRFEKMLSITGSGVDGALAGPDVVEGGAGDMARGRSVLSVEGMLREGVDVEAGPI